MKKRFLATLAVALTITTTSTSTLPTVITVQAATIPSVSEDVKYTVEGMSDEDLVKLLDEAHAKIPRGTYEEGYNFDNMAILNNNGTFLVGKEADAFQSDGRLALSLNPLEEEILRQRFPELLANIPSPICLDAGGDFDSTEVNNEQFKDGDTTPNDIKPDFEKIIQILKRGPYTVDVSGTITANCTGMVEIARKYTVTASYDAKASDNKDFDMDCAAIYIKYNRKKPTKLIVSCSVNGAEKEINKVITLKLPTSLQKKIKSGKVTLSGSNAYSYDGITEMASYKYTTEKSGKLSLSFKFKEKKAAKK